MVDNQPTASSITGRFTRYYHPGRGMCPCPLGLECSRTLDTSGDYSIQVSGECSWTGVGLEHARLVRLDGVVVPTGSDGPPPIPGLRRVACDPSMGGKR